MWEVFFVNKGQGEITVAGETHPLSGGICVVVEPREEHSLINTGDTDLVITYFGIA